MSIENTKYEIIQASIRQILAQIEEKTELIKIHPKDDSEFIDDMKEQLIKLEEMWILALNWRNELLMSE